MTFDWLVNLSGIALIGFIVWWFWIARPTSVAAQQSGIIEIRVADGVYTPAHIELAAGQPVTLRFLRMDPTPCAEKVIFDKLDIVRDLTLNEATDIDITPKKPGEYAFTCQMQMYRGKLRVK